MRFDEKVHNKFSKSTIIAQTTQKEAVMNKLFSRFKLRKQTGVPIQGGWRGFIPPKIWLHPP